MRKFLAFVATLIMLSAFSVLQVASAAEMFSFTGVLSKADPATNPYNANYMAKTANGGVYYLDLSNPVYEDWVGKTATFKVNGSQLAFVVLTSKIGGTASNASQALVKTGIGNWMIAFLASLSVGLGYFFTNKKIGNVLRNL